MSDEPYFDTKLCVLWAHKYFILLILFCFVLWHKNTSHDVCGPDKILSVQYSIAGCRNNVVQLISKTYSSGEPETLYVISRAVVSDSSWSHGLYPTKLLCPWDSPGKNTGAGSHSLLQRIFLTQRSNLGLLHCRQILCHISHQGRPRERTGYSHVKERNWTTKIHSKWIKVTLLYTARLFAWWFMCGHICKMEINLYVL